MSGCARRSARRWRCKSRSRRRVSKSWRAAKPRTRRAASRRPKPRNSSCRSKAAADIFVREYEALTAGEIVEQDAAKERTKPGPTDRLFSTPHRKLLNAILAEEELKKDREGLQRTAYSLRH